jgi:glucose 1-dehydrogenase
VIDVNLTGAFLCAREAARGLRAANAKGVLVFMSSVHEQIPWPKFSHYCAAKGGLKLFMQTIARELAPHGIRCVDVAPGAIDTPINQPVLDEPEQYQAVLDEIPWGRWGQPFADGGMTLYPNFV